MKYLLIVVCFVLIASCKEEKNPHVDNGEPIETKELIASTGFSNYEFTHKALQGQWRNIQDANSIIIFNEKTTITKYLDQETKVDVPYSINTQCEDAATVAVSQEYRYIVSKGATSQCYYITHLDENQLVMKYLLGDITLTFDKVTP